MRDYRIYSDYLTEIREERALTKTQLANELGVSVSYISDLEYAKRAPLSNDKNDILSDFLEIPRHQLRLRAAMARGEFVFDTSGCSPKALEMMCQLFTGWGQYSDETMDKILEVIDGQ